MARSRWKISYFSKSIWKIIFILKKKKKSKLYKRLKLFYTRIYARSSQIPKCFRKIKVKIHKGHVFRRLRITKFMTNYKFGEYTLNRKLYFYPLKKKYRR